MLHPYVECCVRRILNGLILTEAPDDPPLSPLVNILVFDNRTTREHWRQSHKVDCNNGVGNIAVIGQYNTVVFVSNWRKFDPKVINLGDPEFEIKLREIVQAILD